MKSEYPKLVKTLRRKTHTIKVWNDGTDKPFIGQVIDKGNTLNFYTNNQYQLEDALELAKEAAVTNGWA